jgi:hypothetical protein
MYRVSLDDIKMLGHWSGEHVIQSYVYEMPLQACLVRAGMSVSKGLVYVLPRDRVKREEYTELVETLFPGIFDTHKHWTEVSSPLRRGGHPCMVFP